jgi:hypothetical protein
MNTWFIFPITVLMLAAGYLNLQGGSMLFLAGFFGFTDGVQGHLEANPPVQHPTVRLAPRE